MRKHILHAPVGTWNAQTCQRAGARRPGDSHASPSKSLYSLLVTTQASGDVPRAHLGGREMHSLGSEKDRLKSVNTRERKICTHVRGDRQSAKQEPNLEQHTRIPSRPVLCMEYGEIRSSAIGTGVWSARRQEDPTSTLILEFVYLVYDASLKRWSVAGDMDDLAQALMTFRNWKVQCSPTHTSYIVIKERRHCDCGVSWPMVT